MRLGSHLGLGGDLALHEDLDLPVQLVDGQLGLAPRGRRGRARAALLLRRHDHGPRLLLFTPTTWAESADSVRSCSSTARLLLLSRCCPVSVRMLADRLKHALGVVWAAWSGRSHILCLFNDQTNHPWGAVVGKFCSGLIKIIFSGSAPVGRLDFFGRRCYSRAAVFLPSAPTRSAGIFSQGQVSPLPGLFPQPKTHSHQGEVVFGREGSGGVQLGAREFGGGLELHSRPGSGADVCVRPLAIRDIIAGGVPLVREGCSWPFVPLRPPRGRVSLQAPPIFRSPPPVPPPSSAVAPSHRTRPLILDICASCARLPPL